MNPHPIPAAISPHGRGRIRDQREPICFAEPASAEPAPQPPPVAVATARYVLLPLANVITGYSVKAMERKIERGEWVEGQVWRRAPDGRIHLDIEGYQRWVESR